MNVHAVVVTYHPDPARFALLVRAVLDQVQRLTIVDNASSSEFQASLLRLQAAEQRIVLVQNDVNLGIASALNMGCSEALAAGADFVLLLDHDSVPHGGMTKALVDAWHRLELAGVRVAAVGARAVDERSGAALPFIIPKGLLWPYRVCAGDEQLEVSFLNTSGTLLSRNSWEQVGPFDESLFIDYVDTEWCQRARSKELGIYAACAARLGHILGDDVVRLWFAPGRNFYVHSPLRCYYIFRNSVSLYKRGYISFLWKVNDMLRALVRSLMILTASTTRFRHFSMMLRGSWHGLTGRMGAL